MERRKPVSQKIKICAIDDIRDNESVKFSLPNPKGEREGFLIKIKGEWRAYYNECPHVGLSLDWDDSDFFSADFTRLVCKNHGAQFLPHDGACVAGPCAGVGLKVIPVFVEKNIVYTTTEAS